MDEKLKKFRDWLVETRENAEKLYNEAFCDDKDFEAKLMAVATMEYVIHGFDKHFTEKKSPAKDSENCSNIV